MMQRLRKLNQGLLHGSKARHRELGAQHGHQHLVERPTGHWRRCEVVALTGLLQWRGVEVRRLGQALSHLYQLGVNELGVAQLGVVDDGHRRSASCLLVGQPRWGLCHLPSLHS